MKISDNHMHARRGDGSGIQTMNKVLSRESKTIKVDEVKVFHELEKNWVKFNS